MKRTLPFALIATGLLSAPAFADDVDLKAWDENADGQVSLEEWDAAIESQGIFDNLDENKNGIFDVDESDEDLFAYDLEMDLDDGGHIERQEFTVGTFNMFDDDADDQLDEEEFTAFAEKYSSSDLASAEVASAEY